MPAAIEIKNLKKHFGATKAVDGVSFSVEKGEVFGFLGPNGAGKTTTIRCLMDFIRPTSGTLTIGGLDAQVEPTAVKEKVGFLAPDVPLYAGWTGKQHIRFLEGLRGKAPDAEKLAKRLQLDLGKKAGSLSTGNKQKLGLVLAMMHAPEILILDEPTSALDPLLQNEVYTMISECQQRGATVFLSSHNLPEVERVCTRVAIIRQGKLVAVERIDALREKRMHVVTARFVRPFNAEQFKLPHTEVLSVGADHIVLRSKGDLNPLLKLVATAEPDDLEITHASLEDIFLSLYKGTREKEKGEKGKVMLKVFWQTLRDRRTNLIVYCVAGILIVWMYISLYPTIAQQSKGLTDMMKAYPEGIKKAFNMDSLDFSNLGNFLSMEHFSLIWPIMLIAMLVSQAGGGIAGEIEKGTMQLMLAQPVSRLQLFFGRYVAALASLLIFIALTVYSIIPLAELSHVHYVVSTLNAMSLLGFFFGAAVVSLGFLFSTLFSEKGRVYFATSAILVLMYVLNIASSLKASLENLKYVSFFYYYDTVAALVRSEVHANGLLVFGGVAVAATALAAWRFQVRDL